jgi:hypothetical protein
LGHLEQVQPVTRRQTFLTTVLCGVACLAAVSCSKSPSAPTPPIVNIGGPWTGTWSFVTAGATVTDAVAVTFTQTGTTAAGNWSSTSGPGGILTLEIGVAVTGMLSISQTLLNGQNCSASTSVTGTATATRVELALGSLTTAGLCQWASSQTFVFTRTGL